MARILRSAGCWLATIAALGCSKSDLPRTEAVTPRVETQELDYRQGNTALKGFLAWNGAESGRRPGILVVHEWWGHNQHARNQARRAAEAGYVAMAVDMFGDGKVTTHPDSAMAFVQAATKDAAVLLARFTAALELLKQDPRVDPERIAAIGYCFGGSVVLSVARTGTDLDAVVSFHGGLASLPPPDSGTIKARVLVLTGGADPMVPPDQVETFRKEMTAAGAQLEIVSFPDVKHSFTNPDADSVGMAGLGYDAEADRRSWDRAIALFREVWK
jgi:dienelactone hydrolase